MLQLVAQINASHVSVPSSVAKPPAFSPPSYAVWVNSLWFLSFVISLTYAMLATMMHQWAGHYITTTQQLRYGPRKKARLRAFFSDAVGGSLVLPMVRSLPAMIHLSLFLFFAGLIIFLSNAHNTVFLVLMSWMALSITAYMYITVLPILRPNCPYKTPFSSLIWRLFTGLAYVVLGVLSFPLFRTSHHVRILKADYHKRFVEGSMRKRAEKTASQRSSEIDARVLTSTLDAVGEDDSPEEFFKALPGFFNSEQVDDLEEHLLDEFRTKFRPKLNSFLDRIFSSNSVSEHVRSDQFITCLNATHAVLGPDGVSQILYNILSGRWGEVLRSVEMGHSLRGWGNNNDEQFTPFVRRIITQIIIGIRERDGRWISLVVDEFGVPNHMLRDNIRHGESALLSLLIHVIREAIRSRSWTPFTLSSLSQFDVCNTPPELQHEFCALWNEIVQEAWRDGVDSMAVKILREIRLAYIRLHKDTGASPTAFSDRTYYYNPILTNPLSYRICNLSHHRPTQTPRGPVSHRDTALPQTRASNPSLPPSTSQRCHPSNPLYSSTPLESQRLVVKADKDHVAHTAQLQAERASIVPPLPSFTDWATGPSGQTLSQRRTYRSTSPLQSSPLVQIVPRVDSVTGPSVPESIPSATAHGNTLNCNQPASTEVSHHPRQSAESASHVATNVARPRGESTPHIYPSETEETSHACVTTSLTSSHSDRAPTANSSSTRLHLSSFYDPGPVHTNLHPMDGSPPTDTLDSLPNTTLTLTVSHPVGSNDLPTDLKEDIGTPSAASCINGTSSTANSIPQPIPTISAARQRNDSEPNADLPSIIVSECALKLDTVSHPLGSTSPSPIATLSHISLQAGSLGSSVLGVHVTTDIEALSAHDDTRDAFSPIPMKSVSLVPDA